MQTGGTLPFAILALRDRVSVRFLTFIFHTLTYKTPGLPPAHSLIGLVAQVRVSPPRLKPAQAFRDAKTPLGADRFVLATKVIGFH